MFKTAEDFYSSQSEPNRSCFYALREIILSYNELLSETVKYGMPCFTYGKKHFCYLWYDKETKEPYILMVEGNKIDHPMLNSGNRKRMKTLSIDPGSDIPVDLIYEVFDLQLPLYKAD